MIVYGLIATIIFGVFAFLFWRFRNKFNFKFIKYSSGRPYPTGQTLEKSLSSQEAEIMRIWRSTRTTFKKLLPIHNKLRAKYKWYYKAHLHPKSSLFYSSLSIAYAVAVVLFCVFITIRQNPHETHAASTCTAAGSGNWNAGATWSGCGANGPVAGDTVIINNASYTVTLTANAAAATIQVTAGTLAIGTYSLALSSTSTIDGGTVTIGASSSTGWVTTGISKTSGTITCTGASKITTSGSFSNAGTFTAGTSTILMNATATSKTFTGGGQTYNNITFNGSGGGWSFTDGVTTATNGTVTLTAGTLHVDGATDNSGLTHSWGLFASSGSTTRVLTLGTSTVNITGSNFATTWDMTTTTNLTVSATTGNINFTGAAAVAVMPNRNFYNISFTGGGVMAFNGGTGTNHDLTVTATTVKTDNFTMTGNGKFNGTLHINGNSATNRLLFSSNTLGTARTLDITGATMTDIDNVDFQDITFARGADIDLSQGGTKLVGDCGGNTVTGKVLTFTASETQNWNNVNGGNWADANWTGASGNNRVPLPQDDVTFNVVFGAAKTVVQNMPRMGRTVDWSSATWTTSLSWTVTGSMTLYGGLIMKTGMIGTGSSSMTFGGRSTYTLSLNGFAVDKNYIVNAPGGEIDLGSDFSTNGILQDSFGTFDAKTYNVTAGSVATNNGNTRGFKLGTGNIWTVSGNWDASGASMTYDPGTATVLLTGTGNLKTKTNSASPYDFYILKCAYNTKTTTLQSTVYISNLIYTFSGGTLNPSTTYGVIMMKSDGDPLVDTGATKNCYFQYYSNASINIAAYTFAGSVYFYGRTNDMTYTVTSGNFSGVTIYITSYTTNSKTVTLDMNGHNLTLTGSLALGNGPNATNKGAISFGNGTHSIAGTIGANGTGSAIDFGSGTISVASDVTLTGITVTPGSATVTFNATTTKNITSASQSFPRVVFAGAGGVWTLQDNFICTSIWIDNGRLIDNAKTVTVNGDILIDAESTRLTSTGEWTQGASGNVGNGSSANPINSLKLAGPGVTSTLSTAVYTGASLAATAIVSGLTIGDPVSGGTLNGAGFNIFLSANAQGKLHIYADHFTVGSAIGYFRYNATAAHTMDALTFPTGFAGANGLMMITNANLTLGGDLNIGTHNFTIWGDQTGDTPSSFYLDAASANITAANLSVGTSTFNGWIKLGSGTHTLSGALARGGSGTAEKLELGTATTSVGGNITFTEVTVISGGTIIATKATPTQTITSASQSFNNFTHSGAGTLSLADALMVNGNFVHSSGTLTTNSYDITVLGDVTVDSSTTVNAGTTNLRLGGSSKNFAGGGKTFGSVTFGIDAIASTTTSWMTANLGQDDATVGSIPWTTPTNVYADDTNYAIVPFPPLDTKVYDNSIKLVVNGSIAGTDKSAGTQWSGTEAYVGFGGAADKWGLTPTAAQVRDLNNFGVVISSKDALTTVGHYLKLTGFDFSAVPDTVAIDGVEAQFKRKAVVSGSPYGYINIVQMRVTYSRAAYNASYTVTDDAVLSGVLTVNAGSSFSINSAKAVTCTTSASVFNSGTISGAGTFELRDDSAVYFSGGTVTANVKYNTVASGLTIPSRTYGGNVEVYNGTSSNYVATFSAGTVSITGNFTVTKGGSGTITVNADTNDPPISVGGSWLNGGTFTAGTSTVTLNSSTAVVVSGNTTFYDLTIDCNAIGAAKTVSFSPSSTQTITHAIVLNGSAGNVLTIGLDGGTHNVDLWTLTLPSGYTSGDYITVSDSDVTSPNKITANAGGHVTDGGHNPGWIFPGANVDPVNDSLTFSNPSSSNIAIADDTTEWTFRALVTDTDGPTTLNYTELRLANSTDSSQPYDSIKLRWTEATDTFSEEADTQNAITLTSTNANSNASGNQWTLDFKIKINNSFLAKDTNYAAELYTLDDSAASDTDNYADKYQVTGLTLSLDVDNATLDFGALLPGSILTGTTVATVTTNYANGYLLQIADGIAGTNSVLLHTDGSTRIADYAGTITTPTTWSGTGLGICVFAATDKDTSKWGAGVSEVDPANKYAGVPETAATIHTKTGTPTSGDNTSIGYKLVVPNNQKTGNYSGILTYTTTGVLQ